MFCNHLGKRVECEQLGKRADLLNNGQATLSFYNTCLSHGGKQLKEDEWMTCNFTSFSTVFQSYQDHGWMLVGWFWYNDPFRQYFSLHLAMGG